MRNRMFTFIRSQRGSITVMAAMFLVPAITLSVAQVQITRYLAIQTRQHQAGISGVLAAAKEGEKATGQQAVVAGYMRYNMDPVLRGGETSYPPSLVNAGDTASLTASVQGRPLAEKLLGGIFENPLAMRQTVQAERFYNPIEVAIVVDNSSSMEKDIPQYKKTVKSITDHLFNTYERKSGDVRVSLIAFSANVNIGQEYKDKLVTRASRQLFDSSNPANKRVDTVMERGPALMGDLLGPGGPGYTLGNVCVGRKQLPPTATSADLAKYVEDIETPPRTPDEGFYLLMGDGRSYKEGGMSVAEMNYMYYINSNSRAAYPKEVSVEEMALIPKKYVVPSEVYTPSKYLKWGGSTSNWNKIIKEIVQMYADCPVTMPMLIGADTAREVNERIDKVDVGWTTGGDEGLAWAMRALSPSWGEIWEKGEHYPAPYHSGVDKVILYMGGTVNNVGYPTGSGANSKLDTITGMCKKMEENGVALNLFLVGKLTQYANFNKIYTNCVPAERRTVSTTYKGALTAMENAIKRQYRVRLM